ncbi:Response regulatory protein, partial [hydrothermal vent metagenome]
RKELMETVGVEAAKGILTRFGYAQGWRTANSLKKNIPWDNNKEWARGGGRLHQIEGVAKVTPVKKSKYLQEGYWDNSYEAEQHLVGFAKSDEPVCWSLTGFASGYTSAVMKKRVIFIEDKCVAKGDSRCHVIGKPVEQWGKEAESVLRYYSHRNLMKTLGSVAKKLRQTEKKLKEKTDKLKKEEVRDQNISARSPCMIAVLQTAQRTAPVDSTILILGESGSGKELLAKFIHQNSSRAQGDFVPINCGAFPEALLETELFGHVKGAFTGADSDRMGIFEQADGGTLFLDEVGEMTPRTQVRLLRALQEKEIQRVGESKIKKVNVRILAATNQDLVQMVKEKTFREDLYYRLRVVELRLPPLRDRREDIVPLAKLFLDRFSGRYNKNIIGFDHFFADFILRHPWPGNIRELQNVIESAVVLTQGRKLTVQDIPGNVSLHLKTEDDTKRPVLKLSEEVSHAVSNALQVMKGASQAEIAMALGITPATLWRKKKEIEKIRSL